MTTQRADLRGLVERLEKRVRQTDNHPVERVAGMADAFREVIADIAALSAPGEPVAWMVHQKGSEFPCFTAIKATAEWLKDSGDVVTPLFALSPHAHAEGGDAELSIVRENLLTRPGYSPYCGSNSPACRNPRTLFNGTQFECPSCHWLSDFEPEFIERYKAFITPAPVKVAEGGETAWLSQDDARLALFQAIEAITIGNKTDDKLILAKLREQGIWLALWKE